MFSVRKLTVAASFVALGIFGQAAMAADIIRQPPAPPKPVVVVKPATPWHGFYIGGGGGYAWGTFHGHAVTDVPTGPDEVFNPNFRANSWLAWAVIGGDIQRGNHVFGVFADFTWLNDFSGSRTAENGGCTLSFGCQKTFTADIDNITTVAGRWGFSHTPSSLIYGLAGWSWAKGSLSEFEGCTPSCENLFYSGPVHANGWTVGAGVEHLIHPHLSARLEYRFTHLKTSSISGACTPNTTPNCGNDSFFGTASATANVQSVRAALVFRFGGGA
jgi:outer membrane immunogenic protein